MYLKQLEKLISSQAGWEQPEGSETRVDDPILLLLRELEVAESVVLERIMKLQERLEEIEKQLYLELCNQSLGQDITDLFASVDKGIQS